MKDHLHIRGEHIRNTLKNLFSRGSSPHTWRTLDQINAQTNLDRIISTYVENTEEDKRSEIVKRDHLHIRGEH